MNFATGTRLGPYEILAPLGAGGMGEVYRARDTRLCRDVAIKVLPASFANDEDRLRRFEQEAHTTSALNHPNILTVYDIGRNDGSPFIVAELLEGEELRHQLKEGALPVRKAMDYAQQIASGLAAAHSKGIVHRDLKPENLFVTSDGRVKILDFGLAKLRPQLSAPVESGVATQKAITDPGVVLGTVEYMSPEQVRGQSVDYRSDIFSLGVVFYEMLCGERPFAGESSVEVMNAILKEDSPELSEANAKISPALDKIVRRCLEKKPEQRFQSTSDLCFAIEALSLPSGSRVGTAALPAVTESKGKARLLADARMAWMVAGALLLGLLAALYFIVVNSRQAPVETRAVRFLIPTPERASFSSFAISPDGRRLAFVATDSTSGKPRIWVRPLDSINAQPLPETDGASHPFWSPDSRFVAFFADAKLKKIDVSGGPPQTLTSTQIGKGGTWNKQGTIVFAAGPTDGLYTVSSSGGEATPLTTPDQPRENSHRWPQFLPDGRHFIFFSRQPERSGVYVGSLDSKETRRLFDTEFNALYAAPGYLLFVRESALMAQPFDATKLELTGEAFPTGVAFSIADQVALASVDRLSLFSVSDSGVLVFASGGETVNAQLDWYDRTGKRISQVGPVGNHMSLWLSPDEKRVAVEQLEKGSGDIWLIDIARNTPSRFTFDPGWDFSPVWSPDGSRIVFSSARGGLPQLYVKPADGSSNEELLLKGSNVALANDWSLDGRFILYTERNARAKGDLFVLSLEGGAATPRPYLQDDFDKAGAKFSPDGKWVAYASDESGQWQVYVQSFPVMGGKHQVSTSGGTMPRWRRDGKELFYIGTDGKMMAAEVKAGSTFESSLPNPLFAAHTRRVLSRTSYAVSGDGQRFLISDLLETSPSSPLTVVLNWTADLKR